MKNVIGASSLKRALQNLEFDNQNTLGNFITAIPSLRLNPYVQNVRSNLLSRRKQNDIPPSNKYSRLHQVADIELKSLFIVLEHRNDIKALSQNTRSSSKKPFQRKRRFKKVLKQTLKN